jgi:hypothetical protein
MDEMYSKFADAAADILLAYLDGRDVPRLAGYVCWRGIVEEADTPLSIQSRLFDRVTFCFPAGELFLGIPNPGTNNNILPGRRRIISTGTARLTIRALCKTSAPTLTVGSMAWRYRLR